MAGVNLRETLCWQQMVLFADLARSQCPLPFSNSDCCYQSKFAVFFQSRDTSRMQHFGQVREVFPKSKGIFHLPSLLMLTKSGTAECVTTLSFATAIVQNRCSLMSDV